MTGGTAGREMLAAAEPLLGGAGLAASGVGTGFCRAVLLLHGASAEAGTRAGVAAPECNRETGKKKKTPTTQLDGQPAENNGKREEWVISGSGSCTAASRCGDSAPPSGSAPQCRVQHLCSQPLPAPCSAGMCPRAS